MAREQRRLSAILFADVVGSSRLMGHDESGTVARLLEHLNGRLAPAAAHRGGRVIRLTGDGGLVEFTSAVDALAAAIEFQQAMADANRDEPKDKAIVFRIGIHLGDIIVAGDDIYGDHVNVAARLESEAPPGGIVVSRAVREAVEGRLKVNLRALGDLSLKNIERPIRAFRVEWDEADWRPQATPGATPLTFAAQFTPSLALPDKPSIAVLPFHNLSGDPEQQYFADGIVEDIITALSRFKSLFVIARNSSYAYKGRTPDIRQVGRELGIRYVLEGSIRKAAGKVRIAAQLIDSESGSHLWADRFDGSLEDIFELQDQVTTSVVGAIAPRVSDAEIKRAKRKPVESLDAYDCFLRGMADIAESTKDADDEALRLFYSAIERDPDFATPYGMAAILYANRRNKGWVENQDQEVAETRRLAARVSIIGGDDAAALCAAGFAVIYVCQDYEAGAALIDRGLSINSNYAIGWRMRGWASVFLGQHEAALEAFSDALRLSPLDPDIGTTERGIASALFFLGKYDEARTWANKALAHQPNEMATLRVAAVANALARETEAARRIADRVCRQDPALRVSRLRDYLPHRRPEDIDRFAEGLRLSGVPE